MGEQEELMTVDYAWIWVRQAGGGIDGPEVPILAANVAAGGLLTTREGPTRLMVFADILGDRAVSRYDHHVRILRHVGRTGELSTGQRVLGNLRAMGFKLNEVKPGRLERRVPFVARSGVASGLGMSDELLIPEAALVLREVPLLEAVEGCMRSEGIELTGEHAEVLGKMRGLKHIVDGIEVLGLPQRG